MAFNNVEHLGIAVEDLDKAIELFTMLTGKSPYKTEKVPSEGVTTVFFQCGETKLELLGSDSDSGPIGKFIAKRGPGIHHVAFEVEDILKEMERLTQAGFELLNEQPKSGADNKLIAFLHPKSTGGVLVELCQEKRE